jgi:hypothetical protein
MEKRTTTPLTYVTSGAAITRKIFEDLSFQTVGGGSFRNLATLAEQCGDVINFHAVLELSSGGNRRIGIGRQMQPAFVAQESRKGPSGLQRNRRSRRGAS